MPKATDKKPRKKRKPAIEEAIYTSSTGATIRTSQLVNEMLCKFRAEYIGIDTGDKPWEHPSLKEFYMNQWGDISSAIRRYGDRIVLEAVQRNRWVCDSKYNLSHPLRSRKLIEQMQQMKQASQAQPQIRIDQGHCTPTTLPQNHVKEVQKKTRDF